MSNQPRTRDTQAVPTRPLRVKGMIRSRKVKYAVNGRSTRTQRAEYIASMFPGQDLATYKAMHNALDRNIDANRGLVPTREQILAQGIFDGLLDD